METNYTKPFASTDNHHNSPISSVRYPKLVDYVNCGVNVCLFRCVAGYLIIHKKFVCLFYWFVPIFKYSFMKKETKKYKKRFLFYFVDSIIRIKHFFDFFSSLFPVFCEWNGKKWKNRKFLWLTKYTSLYWWKLRFFGRFFLIRAVFIHKNCGGSNQGWS